MRFGVFDDFKNLDSRSFAESFATQFLMFRFKYRFRQSLKEELMITIN